MDRRRFHPQRLLAPLLGIALLAGCGLFKPKEPRVAVIVPAAPCRAQTLPDSVVDNIVVHYGEATACYVAQLADSVDATKPGFHFYPDIQDSLDRSNPPIPSPYNHWDKAVEVSVTQNISSSFDKVEVFFDSEYAGRVTSPSRETRYYNYHLITTFGSATTRYQGQAEITFVQGTSDWFLETFRDHRDTSGLPTWGALRADKRT